MTSVGHIAVGMATATAYHDGRASAVLASHGLLDTMTDGGLGCAHRPPRSGGVRLSPEVGLSSSWLFRYRCRPGTTS